jgi:hypothetical protein
LRDYLRAAIAKPSLFGQAPATLIANIETVVAHFGKSGLTLPAYLRCAVKLRSLFYQSPATICSNIEGVVSRFRADGLTLPDYLRAAIKQPSLFQQSPPTIIGHVQMLVAMQRQGLVSFPATQAASVTQPMRPLFAFLVQSPKFFCMADDNFRLRELYVRVTGDRPSGAALLKRPRHRIERDLARALRAAASNFR